MDKDGFIQYNSVDDSTLYFCQLRSCAGIKSASIRIRQMTEEQAKTKWCPMVRTGLVAGSMAVNHHVNGDVNDETRCIASGCMLWVWKWEFENLDFSKTEGHCGLTG